MSFVYTQQFSRVLDVTTTGAGAHCNVISRFQIHHQITDAKKVDVRDFMLAFAWQTPSISAAVATFQSPGRPLQIAVRQGGKPASQSKLKVILV